MQPYQLHNNNLGDHWTSYSLMTVLGQMHRKQYSLGTINGGVDYTSRIEEIAGLLSHNEFSPNLIRTQGIPKVDPWHNWCFPALPVRESYRWKARAVEQIACFQFDGISSAEDKNPPQSLVDELRQYMHSLGLKTVFLGSGLSLAECAELMSKCALFAGCDSGMSHIAHSVGCPVYLYENKLPTYTCHKLKQADLFRSLPEFKWKSEHWLKLLRL
jgi:hypothetical protein